MAPVFDDLADRFGIGEKRNDLFPVSPPRLADGREFVAPFILEFIEP